MKKYLSVGGIFAWGCLSAMSAWAAQWIYDSEYGVLWHDTLDWDLKVLDYGDTLGIGGIVMSPSSPSPLPLADPVAGGYAITEISISTWNITDLTMPASVTWISLGKGDHSLTNITVASGNPVYSSMNGVLYSALGTELIYFPQGRSGTFAIPDGVTSIGNFAFAGCDQLSGVSIPDSVVSIGNETFCDCRTLEEVTIGNGITHIGMYAFGGCNSLTNLVLPASIHSIGWSAFAPCDLLATVTFEGAYPEESAYSIYGYYWNGGGDLTTYVYAAHTNSWTPHVENGSLANGTATWQENPIRMLPNPSANITVTLDKREGSFAGPTTKTVCYDSAYGTLSTPVRDGHVFDGWWTGPNGAGIPVSLSSLVASARNHTLYAKWLVDVTLYASEALGTTNLVWLTEDGDCGWWNDWLESYDGEGSMRSARNLASFGRSCLRTEVTGPGILQFRWRASSEEGYDFLRFYVDGEKRVDGISGVAGWRKVTIPIPAGTHVLEWAYEKDGRVDNGEDCGWLDAVTWPAVSQSPEDDFWLWENALLGSSWLPNYLLAAHDGFTTRLQQTPDDVPARVYRAITAIAALTENAGFRALIEEFGVSLDTELFTATAAFTSVSAPASNEAVDRVAAQALPAIDAALADLEAIPLGWAGTVEIAANDSGFDEAVYVDIADVLLAKSALYAARAVVQIAQAYDLSVDYGKTNVHEVVIAPFELPYLEETFDGDFSKWADMPVLMYGERDILEYVKFARSATQVFLLVKAQEDWLMNWGSAGFYTEDGYSIQYNDFGGLSDGELASWSEYETYWDEDLGSWVERELEFTAVQDGEMLLIARDLPASLAGQPFLIQSAYVHVECMVDEWYWWDYVNWEAKTRLQPAGRFLEDHPDFMKTVRDAGKLQLAKESLRSALLSTQAADTSITGRTGDAWHFIEFAPDQTNWLAEARQKLSETLASLDAPQHITICYTNEKEVVNGYWEETYDPVYGYWYYDYVVTSVETQRTEIVNQTENIYLGALFETPYLTRALLPRFSKDNEVVLGTFSDPTFGGVFPEWVSGTETNLIGRVPVMQERAFQTNGQWFHTGGRGLWSIFEGNADAAISGEIRRTGKVSWVETTVTGPGLLDFSWALTEAEDRESSLEIYVDGMRQAGRIVGDTGWVPRQIEIPTGQHTVRWTYTLMYDWTEDTTAEASFGWLTDFLWAPDMGGQDHTTTTPVNVPYTWLDGYPGLFGAGDDYESAALDDQDGDGMATWEEYVADTNPLEKGSVFRALIEANSAGITIGWTPNSPAREYGVEGKEELKYGWGETNAASRFFRVKVSIPTSTP